jgi:hypothetical protein
MVVGCRVLASVESREHEVINRLGLGIRLRTPHVNENPLTHDPGGRIREVYAMRVHMVRPTTNTQERRRIYPDD